MTDSDSGNWTVAGTWQIVIGQWQYCGKTVTSFLKLRNWGCDRGTWQNKCVGVVTNPWQNRDFSFSMYLSCSLSPEITPFHRWTVAKSWQDRDRTVTGPWLCYIKNALFHREIFLIGIPIIFHLKNVVFTLKTWFSEVFSCLFSKKSKLWDEDSQMRTWLPRFWGLHDFIGFLGIVLSIWNFFRVLYI